jgi:hypothetical protein
MKNSLFRTLSFLLLTPFLLFAPLELVECENLDPDGWLDSFVIPQNSGASATVHKDRSSIYCFSNFCSRTDSIQYHLSRSAYSHLFTSELILSVSLRC